MSVDAGTRLHEMTNLFSAILCCSNIYRLFKFLNVNEHRIEHGNENDMVPCSGLPIKLNGMPLDGVVSS